MAGWLVLNTDASKPEASGMPQSERSCGRSRDRPRR